MRKPIRTPSKEQLAEINQLIREADWPLNDSRKRWLVETQHRIALGNYSLVREYPAPVDQDRLRPGLVERFWAITPDGKLIRHQFLREDLSFPRVMDQWAAYEDVQQYFKQNEFCEDDFYYAVPTLFPCLSFVHSLIFNRFADGTVRVLVEVARADDEGCQIHLPAVLTHPGEALKDAARRSLSVLDESWDHPIKRGPPVIFPGFAFAEDKELPVMLFVHGAQMNLEWPFLDSYRDGDESSTLVWIPKGRLESAIQGDTEALISALSAEKIEVPEGARMLPDALLIPIRAILNTFPL